MVSGGYTDYPSAPHTQSYSYNPATNSWTTLPDAQFPAAGAGGSCGFYKIGGISDNNGTRTADSEVLSGLNVCGAAAIPWRSENPTTVTLQPGQSVKVTVTLSATTAGKVTQPGTYTAQIGFEQDTPYVVSPENVTMNVTSHG